jgi:hypothetical protein
MSELCVLVPRDSEWDARERIVLRAAVEAAKEIGAEKILSRRCDVYAIGVYLKDGASKRLVYIDFDRSWSSDRIRDHIVSSAPRKSMEDYVGGLQVVF